MNISEIESTLQTLIKRHKDLNESMLVMLLTSSGWEEKMIKDAVLLFRNLPKNQQVASSVENNKEQSIPPTPVVKEEKSITLLKKDITINGVILNKEVDTINSPQSPQNVPLPIVSKNEKIEELPQIQKLEPEVSKEIVYYDSSGQEEEVVPASLLVDDGKELPKVEPLKIPTIDKEPESLIIPDVVVPQVDIVQASSLNIHNEEKQIEPPLNLPLKPFESTQHVWPFSKYKEVFHGDVMPPLSQEERVLVQGPTVKKDETEKEVVKKVRVKKIGGFDGEDEGLIFLTGISLLIILFLLAYMYSNGRL